jgi:hypothetical protein
MMEVVLASETSACFNETTRRHIPEGCHIPVSGCTVQEEVMYVSLGSEFFFQIQPCYKNTSQYIRRKINNILIRNPKIKT